MRGVYLLIVVFCVSSIAYGAQTTWTQDRLIAMGFENCDQVLAAYRGETIPYMRQKLLRATTTYFGQPCVSMLFAALGDQDVWVRRQTQDIVAALSLKEIGLGMDRRLSSVDVDGDAFERGLEVLSKLPKNLKQYIDEFLMNLLKYKTNEIHRIEMYSKLSKYDPAMIKGLIDGMDPRSTQETVELLKDKRLDSNSKLKTLLEGFVNKALAQINQ